MRKVFRKQAHIAFGVQAVHALKRNFLLLPWGQIKRRICEIKRAVWAEHHVVGTVESLSFEVVSKNLIISIFRNGNDGPQDAGAINQSAHPVVGVTIGITERNEFLFSPIVQVYAEDFIERLVADIEEA